MTEWIDFVVYAVQVLLVWVFLPRQGRQFTLPTIADRNPDWLAGHRDVAARIERSRAGENACYVWAVVTLATLLVVALDVVSTPFGTRGAKWEVLKDVHGMFLIVGILLCGAWTLLWWRWVGTHVPLAATRHATLKPRVTSDYLRWPWRVVVELLTVLHIGVWVVVGALGWAGGVKYWSAFAFFVVMTILFAAFAAWVPRRRPGFPDRMFGEGYRRTELKVAYGLRLTPLIPGGMVISEQAFGLDPDRVGHLLLVSAISALILAFLRLRPLAAPPIPKFDAKPRINA
jgi:hypothetical protein